MGLSAPARGYIHVNGHQAYSLKLLGQSKSNFMWSVQGKGVNSSGHMTKLAATHIYGKNLYKSSSQELKSYDLETWNVASGSQTTNLV